MLFVVTLGLNFIALYVVRKYQRNMSEQASVWDSDAFQQRLRKRYRKERIFRAMGWRRSLPAYCFWWFC